MQFLFFQKSLIAITLFAFNACATTVYRSPLALGTEARVGRSTPVAYSLTDTARCSPVLKKWVLHWPFVLPLWGLSDEQERRIARIQHLRIRRVVDIYDLAFTLLAGAVGFVARTTVYEECTPSVAVRDAAELQRMVKELNALRRQANEPLRASLDIPGAPSVPLIRMKDALRPGALYRFTKGSSRMTEESMVHWRATLRALTAQDTRRMGVLLIAEFDPDGGETPQTAAERGRHLKQGLEAIGVGPEVVEVLVGSGGPHARMILAESVPK